ncbi:MAG: hypothetical protein DI629_12245 [Mesorhizobium amorphae]|nr:MAG: hypothetical protein DI629_12245 [Mesorhizobium amorphae]
MMFFCYERDFAMRWCPVVYHDEKPTKMQGRASDRTAFQTVPAECLDMNGEPMFGALQRAFPAPREAA